VRELGALRTLGFPRRALVVSFLQESLLTTSAGGIVAAAAGLLLLDGLAVRFSMGAFAMQLDAIVLLVGLLAGAGMALVGVVPPLWRCLRLPIVEALRTGYRLTFMNERDAVLLESGSMHMSKMWIGITCGVR
jgi:putative ABC transport system permease protein